MKIISIGTSPLMSKGILSGFESNGFEVGTFPFKPWYTFSFDEGVHELTSCFNNISFDILLFGGYAPSYFIVLKDLLKKYNKKFIYWAIEDPVGFDNTLEIAKLADYVFTTSIECIPKYKKYNIDAHLLTFACNPNYHKSGFYKKEYDIDITMAASYYSWKTRLKGYDIILDAAKDSNYNLKVWGSGWNSKSGMDRLGDTSLYGGYFPNGELPNLCASSKIILGIQCDDSSITQTSMRPYEVLGCCGFHLTQWTKATDSIFKDGIHLVTAKTKEDALDKINYYINHDKERLKIALAGQDFVYKYHTYEIRVKDNILPFLI